MDILTLLDPVLYKTVQLKGAETMTTRIYITSSLVRMSNVIVWNVKQQCHVCDLFEKP